MTTPAVGASPLPHDPVPDAPHGPARAAAFSGWRVVAGVFWVLMVAAGLGFYNATVYLQAVVEEQGLTIGAASGATAGFFVTFGLAGLVVSRLIARWDPRPVIIAGAVLGGAALLALGSVQRLWQLYAVLATFGVAFAAVSFVPGTTLVTRWFVRRRALALSIATTGLSVGGIVITPLSASLIARDGLAATAPWLALAWVVGIVPMTLALIRPSPAAMGMAPDGDAVVPGSPPVAPAGMARATAIRTRYFRLLTLAFSLLMLSQIGIFAHLFPLATQRVGAAFAPQLISTVAAASIVGRFGGAWVLTRMPPLRMTTWLAVLQVAAILGLATSPGAPGLLVAAVAFGFTLGNLLVLIPVLLVEAFGVRDYAGIYSANQLLATLGIAAGPILMGVLRDATGGYATPLLLAAGASAFATAVLAVAQAPEVDDDGLPRVRAAQA